MIRPWLLLARRRLIASFAVSLLFALFTHMLVSAESPMDIGVFWHHFCGCPAGPSDFRALLNFPLTACLVGVFFGIGANGANTNTANVPTTRSNTLFLFTRPVSRATILLAPLAVATAAIAILPLFAYLLLLGWLRLVHAPSLLHLLAILQQLPAAAALGPHPRLFDLFSAIEFPRRYVASIALGLCSYTFMASQRWLMLSPNRKLQIFGMMPIVLFVPLLLRVSGEKVSRVVFMTAGRGAPLGHAPSTLLISLHFAFAAAVVFGCWRLLRTIEI